MQNELQRSWEVLVVVVSALVCIKEGVCALWALSQDVLAVKGKHTAGESSAVGQTCWEVVLGTSLPLCSDMGQPGVPAVLQQGGELLLWRRSELQHSLAASYSAPFLGI